LMGLIYIDRQIRDLGSAELAQTLAEKNIN
jgi:hypothetical protein